VGRVRESSYLILRWFLSPDPRVRRWQERWEPVLRRVFAGLRLTRDIPSLITQAGFWEFDYERDDVVQVELSISESSLIIKIA
jgi:hypothetical protein